MAVLPNCAAHARELLGDCRERLLPGHFAIAVVAGALLAFAPAFANGGARDAQRRMHHRAEWPRACWKARDRVQTARSR